MARSAYLRQFFMEKEAEKLTKQEHQIEIDLSKLDQLAAEFSQYRKTNLKCNEIIKNLMKPS